MTFDLLIDILAGIGALTCLWWVVVGVGRLLGWVERSEIARQAEEARAEARARFAHPVVAPAVSSSSGDAPADHLAVIAGAIAAVGSGFRVIHLTDVATGQAWASEGRWMHQTSHHIH
jgi:hypothetical protein